MLPTLSLKRSSSKKVSSMDIPLWSDKDQSTSLLSPSSSSSEIFTHRRSVLKTSQRLLTSCLLIFAKVLLLGFSLYGLYAAAVQPLYERITRPSDIICNCGKSIAEAVSRDCKFDSLATSWLPAACRDDALTEEFDRAGPGPNGEWTYYLNRNRSQPISIEQVAMLADASDMEGRSFWMTSEWHTAHCLFYWRKSQRSMNRIKSGGRSAGADKIEETFTDAIHVEHCAMEFLHRRDPDALAVEGYSGFGDPLEAFDPAEFSAGPNKKGY